MPIYTYICDDCGHKFDFFTQVKDDNEKPKCEKCGSERTKKTIAGFSVGKSSKNSSSNCPTGTCPLG